jgi:hypothetical protein
MALGYPTESIAIRNFMESNVSTTKVYFNVLIISSDYLPVNAAVENIKSLFNLSSPLCASDGSNANCPALPMYVNELLERGVPSTAAYYVDQLVPSAFSFSHVNFNRSRTDLTTWKIDIGEAVAITTPYTEFLTQTDFYIAAFVAGMSGAFNEIPDRLHVTPASIQVTDFVPGFNGSTIVYFDILFFEDSSSSDTSSSAQITHMSEKFRNLFRPCSNGAVVAGCPALTSGNPTFGLVAHLQNYGLPVSNAYYQFIVPTGNADPAVLAPPSPPLDPQVIVQSSPPKLSEAGMIGIIIGAIVSGEAVIVVAVCLCTGRTKRRENAGFS